MREAVFGGGASGFWGRVRIESGNRLQARIAEEGLPAAKQYMDT
ncbi:protein of unknown function [Methylacidimicrobium sp. AP8]|nr:protein of unknown function [Methylacidimicrobium sp. AP8]